MADLFTSIFDLPKNGGTKQECGKQQTTQSLLVFENKHNYNYTSDDVAVM